MVATVAGIHLGLDTHANRPAANTVPDASFYSCSTHGLIYKSNFAGNSWATWATLGGGGGGAPVFVGAVVYNSATQVLSASAKLAFNNEDIDTDGFHDNATNNSRLTIPAGKTGKYLVSGYIYRGSSDTPELYFLVNNTTRVRGSYTATAWAGGPRAIVSLTAADYIEMQTPSSTATVGHASDLDKMNTFSIVLLGT